MAAVAEICQAWLMWAESFLRDAEQLPYRAMLIAFTVGAVLSWFAAKEWITEGGEEIGKAEEPGDG